MRRYLFRRLRNLLMLTTIAALLYLMKTLGIMETISENNLLQEAPHPENSISEVIGYFIPSSTKKIDWHNYKQIRAERKRVGIGEQGLPAHLSKKEAALEKSLYAVNGFNAALSDRILLNRSIPDIRHKGCRQKVYLESLPTVSVVVPFHDEHWSTLLRTAHSVLARSPEHLIKEILLVDDASTKGFLKDELDAYLASHMPSARVVRLGARGGLITARLAGARQAAGDVLLFLDSHTEANVNYLPPLLEPIALDYRTVVCPFIDVIAHDTFQYRAQDEGSRGAFDWEFFYKRLPVLPKDEANMPEPFESPVMAGGLFAISRKFFWELGGYDPGLDIWGGEQYELSFKIWQCGGRMLDAPCSRVGHIYRKFAPFPNPGRGDFVGKNYRRVAEVWMDEYAQYLYLRRPHYRDIHPGDISEQKALRHKLKCKSFRWFMTQIAFDLVVKYPVTEPEPFASGRVSSLHRAQKQIRPELYQKYCIDAHRGQQGDKLTTSLCAGGGPEIQFLFSYYKDIRLKHRNMCWDLPDSSPKSPILLYSCHLGGGHQLWRYHPDTKLITQGHSDNCVEFDPATRGVHIAKCGGGQAQRWTVDSVDVGMLDKWDSKLTRVTGPVEDVKE